VKPKVPGERSWDLYWRPGLVYGYRTRSWAKRWMNRLRRRYWKQEDQGIRSSYERETGQADPTCCIWRSCN
jgi:hypothetical protein